jgi:ABC-2 type transport system permease protein
MKNLKKEFLTTFITGTALLAGIVIVLNMIFNNINIGRFDLTADQVYKLSPGVEKILSDLEAPIEITYYVSSSEKMPTQWKNLERDVIDKLKEIKLASKGKLSYTVFDPSAEEEKEEFEEERQKEEDKDILGDQPTITRKKIKERLQEKSVIPFAVQSTERDEIAVKRVYSSIVLSYLDRKEDVIQEVRPETFGNLEYDIMSRIYKLISNRRPRIGFYPGKPDIPPQQMQYYRQGPPPDQYEFAAKLLREQGYDITRTNIKKDDPVPEDIKTMVLMVDQPLNERQMYEIDKLVHRGVRIVLAGQQYNYQITPSRAEPGEFDVRGMSSQLNINSLIKNYGVEFDDQMFMDQSSAFIGVPVLQTQRRGIFNLQQQRIEPVSKPIIIKVTSENINKKLSISNKISDIIYLQGGRLIVHDDLLQQNSIQSEILFTSSNLSWSRQSYGYGPVNVTPPPKENMLKHQPLGILLAGQFKPKYVDQNIPQWQAQPGEGGETETAALPSEITGESSENKMIVMGCTNMFKNEVLQGVTSHVALLVNSVDALTLGEELIHIRSKNIAARRIKATSSFGKTAAKGFVIWFVPALLVAAGIYLTIRRKMK